MGQPTTNPYGCVLKGNNTYEVITLSIVSVRTPSGSQNQMLEDRKMLAKVMEDCCFCVW